MASTTNNEKIKPGFMIIMLLMIYLSDALLFTYNTSAFLTKLPQYALVALAGIYCGYYIYKTKFRVNRSFLWVIIICIFLASEALIHDEFRGGYISKISLFLLGYCFFSFYDSEMIIKAYKKWMDIICVFSLFGVVFGKLIINIGFLPKITTIASRSFVFLGLTNVSTSDWLRNYGPFTEPSRFQAFICLALIFELFVRSNDLRINWKRVALYIIAIVTTFSATAFIGLTFVFIAFFTSKEVNLSFGKRIGLILVIIVAVALLLNFSSGVNMAVTKLQMGQDSESFKVRFNSIVGGIRVAVNNPIFGSGFDRFESEYLRAINNLVASRSQVVTATCILYFAKFGMFVGFYFIYNCFCMFKSFAKIYTAIILMVAFFFATSGISLVDSIIFTGIIFYRSSIVDNDSLRMEE